MSNELTFFIKKIPDFFDFYEAMVNGLEGFSVPFNQMVIGVSAKKGRDVSDRFLMIQDIGKDLICWISFSYFDPNLMDDIDPDFPFLLSVQFRGERNKRFALMVALILSDYFCADFIFDDAHIVKNKDFLEKSEIREILKSFLSDFYLKG